MRPPLVVVHWKDARDVHEECLLEDVIRYAGVAHRQTAGLLVFDGINLEGDDVLVLAHDWDAPDSVGNFSILLRGWVTKIIPFSPT